MEKKKKIVEIDFFVSFDGKEFESEEDCLHYEATKNGERIVCLKCKGIKGSYENDGFNPTKWTDCSKCSGRGFLELKWC